MATEPTQFHKRANDLFGFVPTLFDDLVRSPAVANAYLSALEALEDGVLTDGSSIGRFTKSSPLSCKSHSNLQRFSAADVIDIVVPEQVPLSDRNSNGIA